MTTFAVNIVLLCDPLWLRANSRNIADQLSRSGTSTASNYRVASRARSRREFISKIGIALEECDESLGWLEVILGTRKAPPEQVQPLLKECEELVAILSASRTTAINRSREQALLAKPRPVVREGPVAGNP